MKLAIILVLAVALAGMLGFVMLAQKSKNGAPPGLIDGALTPCPSSPNCVSSEAGTPPEKLVAPFPLAAWIDLPELVEQKGGRVVQIRPDYFAAEFSTPLMGYVDDVEFRKGEDAVHVRSASRVGRSDLGANKKRIDMLRAALEG